MKRLNGLFALVIMALLISTAFQNCAGGLPNLPPPDSTSTSSSSTSTMTLSPPNVSLFQGGTVTFVPIGGTPPYHYLISPTTIGTIDINTGFYSASTVGNATVTAVDANGAQASSLVSIAAMTPTPGPTPVPAPSPSPAPTPVAASGPCPGGTNPCTIAASTMLNLAAGQSLLVGGVNFTMQFDGNFVAYKNGVAVFAASSFQFLNIGFFGPATYSNCTTCTASFQSDGNFVLYGPNGPYWSTSTAGQTDARLVLSDGILSSDFIIQDSVGNILFSGN